MSATHLGKIKKNDFIDALWKLNNKEKMDWDIHNEFDYETNKNTKIYLYYNKQGHIGSWSKGRGWYFEESLPKQKGEE